MRYGSLWSRLDEPDRLRQKYLEQRKREVALGVEQADRGEVSPLDIEQVKAEGRRRLAKNSTPSG